MQNDYFNPDDPISGDDDYQPREKPGVYRFRVTGLEWGESKGAKTAGATVAHLTLTIFNGNQESEVHDRLIFVRNLEWKHRQFWKSVGELVSGQKDFRPDWKRVIGAGGDLELKEEKYFKDGQEKTAIKVARYLEPVPNTKQKLPAFLDDDEDEEAF